MKPSPRLTLHERFVNGLARFTAQRAGALLTASILLVGFFILFLPRLQSETNVDDFVLDNDPAFHFYKKFKGIFQKEEFFVVAYKADDLFTVRRLTELKALTEQLRAVEGVVDVTSLANVTDMRGTEDAFDAGEFLRDIPADPAALEALHRRAVGNPLYQGSFISRDGKTTALVVYTRRYGGEAGEAVAREDLHEKMMDRVNAVLAPYRASGRRFAVAGWPITNYYLTRYMMEDIRFFLPLSLVLTLLTVAYVFRNTRQVALAGVGILLTLAATMGLAGLAGIRLNNASVAAIPLIMALALSDLTHLFFHLDRRLLTTCAGPRDALEHVLRAVLFPCLLTTINTAIGFFSYTFNSVAAIRSFGWLATLGMVFEFIITFGLIAPLLVFMNAQKLYRDQETHQETREIPRFLRWSHRRITARPVWALAVCLGAVAWGAWESRHIRVETNLVEFFKPTSPLRQDLDYIRGNLAGMEPLDLSFTAAGPEVFKEPAVLAALDKIKQDIKDFPEVEVAVGVTDFFKEMNKAFHGENPADYRLPKTRRLLEQYLLLYGPDDLKDYVTPEYDHARIALRAHVPGSQAADVLIKKIQKILDENPIPGVQSRVVGQLDLAVRTMKVMVRDQVGDILGTVVVIFLLMVVVLRSWGLALFFLVPNLFPLAVNFGLMGAFGITLDTGTAMIAASAFGIIVDDSVHFFTAYRRRRDEGRGVAESLEMVTYEKGESATSSFLILTIAFGVMMFSQFTPVFFFGLLNVLILLVGMAGEQLLVKSIFTLWARRSDRAPTPA